MKKILCILLLLAMPLSADMITRDALDDNYMPNYMPTTNRGTLTVIRVGLEGTASGVDSITHGWFGDDGIDDALTAIGEVNVDSAYYIFYIASKSYFATGEYMYLALRGCVGDQISVENEQTWTRYKALYNWTIPGGDTTATISDTVTITNTTTTPKWDTLHMIVGAQSPYAESWLYNLTQTTYNTGAFLIGTYTSGDRKLYVDIRSEQYVTDPALQPRLEIFYHMTTGPSGARKIMGLGPKGMGQW